MAVDRVDLLVIADVCVLLGLRVHVRLLLGLLNANVSLPSRTTTGVRSQSARAIFERNRCLHHPGLSITRIEVKVHYILGILSLVVPMTFSTFESLVHLSGKVLRNTSLSSLATIVERIIESEKIYTQVWMCLVLILFHHGWSFMSTIMRMIAHVTVESSHSGLSGLASFDLFVISRSGILSRAMLALWQEMVGRC